MRDQKEPGRKGEGGADECDLEEVLGGLGGGGYQCC